MNLRAKVRKLTKALRTEKEEHKKTRGIMGYTSGNPQNAGSSVNRRSSPNQANDKADHHHGCSLIDDLKIRYKKAKDELKEVKKGLFTEKELRREL